MEKLNFAFWFQKRYILDHLYQTSFAVLARNPTSFRLAAVWRVYLYQVAGNIV